MQKQKHIIIDSEGLLLATYVGAANENDGKEEIKLLPELQKNYKNIEKITSNGIYRKTFEIEAKSCGIEVEITRGCIVFCVAQFVQKIIKRLSKDYQKTILSANRKKSLKLRNYEKLAFISMSLNHF